MGPPPKQRRIAVCGFRGVGVCCMCLSVCVCVPDRARDRDQTRNACTQHSHRRTPNQTPRSQHAYAHIGPTYRQAWPHTQIYTHTIAQHRQIHANYWRRLWRSISQSWRATQCAYALHTHTLACGDLHTRTHTHMTHAHTHTHCLESMEIISKAY